MAKRLTELAVIYALALTASSHTSDVTAQVRYLQGCRGEQNQVTVALLSLRNSIASGDIADLERHISSEYIEAGLVWDTSRGAELKAVLRNRLDDGKTSNNRVQMGEVSGAGVKMAPLWDLDLSKVEMLVNSESGAKDSEY